MKVYVVIYHSAYDPIIDKIFSILKKQKSIVKNNAELPASTMKYKNMR